MAVESAKLPQGPFLMRECYDENFTLRKFLNYLTASVKVQSAILPYGRKSWRELNLADRL